MLKELRKNPIKGVTGIFAASFFIMCVFWIITGFRFNAKICLRVDMAAFIILCMSYICYCLIFSIRQRARLEKLSEHAFNYGYDDEYYNMAMDILKKENGEQVTDSSRLILAAAYAEGMRAEKCRAVLKEIDFIKLSNSEQEQYFNIMLYNALLDKDLPLAEEIYRRASFYFDRAIFSRKSGDIIHTIGTLKYAQGKFPEAEKYFLDAKRFHGKRLKCECDLSLAQCCIQAGKTEEARKYMLKAAKNIGDRKQAAMLQTLINKTEKAA